MIGGAVPSTGQAAECATVMTDNDRIPQVLVVDDEPNIRELVQVALKFHGCAVSTAAGGMDAIRQAEALRPDPPPGRGGGPGGRRLLPPPPVGGGAVGARARGGAARAAPARAPGAPRA